MWFPHYGNFIKSLNKNPENPKAQNLQRHLFTVVLTLSSSGDGRCEWRQIASDGSRLEDVVLSTMPSVGNLAIHGLNLGLNGTRVFVGKGPTTL